MLYSDPENANLQLLCNIAVKESACNARTKEVKLNDSMQFTSMLKSIELNKDDKYVLWNHKHEITTWKEWILILITIFGDSIGVEGGLSADNIYNLTCFFRNDWTKIGPCGGKTIKNTIYSVCSSAAKKHKLSVTKYNRRSYYSIREHF